MAANRKSTLKKTVSQTDLGHGMVVPKEWMEELPRCEAGKRIEVEFEDGAEAGKRWEFSYSVRAYYTGRDQAQIRGKFLKTATLDEFFGDKRVVEGDRVVLEVLTDPNNNGNRYRIKAQRKSFLGWWVTLRSKERKNNQINLE